MAKKIKVDGGAKAALDLLTGLDPDNREGVLKKMAEIDPDLTQALVANLIDIDDLTKMTMKMMQDFLKRVDQSELVLALKLSNPQTQNFFLEKANRSLVLELKETLSGPKVSKSKCLEARDSVISLIKEMCEEGSLVLNSNDEYV